MPSPRQVAVVGGGWAGLAAAVAATRRGHQITLFEMAPQLGGRARQVEIDGQALDNGQHILIGAYSETLALMKAVGVDVEKSLLRRTLCIAYPDGAGLQLPPGPPAIAFIQAVMRYRSWDWRSKCALLAAASKWTLQRFDCPPELTVADLTGSLPAAVRAELVDPLCVAALNTPASGASAAVFLKVLKDALFAGPGSADLLLPRQALSALLPAPAARWLAEAGASIRLSERVASLEPSGKAWRINGQEFDDAVLACTATEAARLTQAHAPQWSAQAGSLRYEPIVTVYARSAGARLPYPMMALRSDGARPAQFVFDLGILRTGLDGVLAFVISGAAPWVERGSAAVTAAALAQGERDLAAHLRTSLEPVHTAMEKRATFLCTPGLVRSAQRVLPHLFAAGDYVSGPYPATLEGAVRSGTSAAACIG